MEFKQGQIIKNKRTKVVRRITAVKGFLKRVWWSSLDGKNKGNCTKKTLSGWVNGE